VHNEVVYTKYDKKFLLLSQTFLHIWGQPNEMCSGTLVACWTTSCLKGFYFVNLLCFTHDLPDVTTSKLCEESKLEILFGIVFTKFMVYFGEEIIDFHSCCGRFSATEIETYF